MTRATNARLAGSMFLLYIAIGVTSMVLFGRASEGVDAAARLDAIALHSAPVRVTILLGFLTGFVALTLAVSLYALTREVDRDLALLALACRLIEGMMAAVGTVVSLALLGLATGEVDMLPVSRTALGALILRSDAWFTTTSATAFAVGSALFCYLFIRGRVVPMPLAWLGLVASLILLLLLPVRLIGLLHGPVAAWMWLPMLLFEVPCGIWLIARGGRERAI